MNCIVKLDCVSKCYVEGAYIIRDCSLEVYEGEFLTILGPSGCGKTTLLRMISGLEHVSKGKIYLDSNDVTSMNAAVRPVNTVFQNFALFSHMTIEDNIGYGLKIKGVSKEEIKTRVQEMLELVQLTGYEKRKPSQLSGGEQQRVAIARGLINNPKVLLLDEPLSSLDLKLKKQMQLELKRLQRKLGITFIYVTHSQDEALTMSDRIVILNQGKIEQQGSPQDIYCHPKSLFVADFIGESNLLNGTVVKKTNNYVTVCIDKNYFLKVKDNSFEVGDEVYLVIRPEDVQVQEKKCANSMEGIVREIIYNGNSTKLMIGLENMELKALVNSDEVFCKRRNHVFVTFDASHCTLFRRFANEKK